MPNYYVNSFTGDDSNDGSVMNPFKTVSKASSVLLPNDCVYIAPGVYRERIVPPCDNVSYIGTSVSEFNPVFIRGSIQWTPEEKQDSETRVYKGVLDDCLFPDNSQIDGASPFKVAMCVTPYGKNGAPEYANGDKTADPELNYCLGQVFDISGNPLTQQGKYSDLLSNPGSWFYDFMSNTLYIHYALDRDAGEPVEIVNQRRLCAPHKRGLKNITLKNIVFERCGNQYPNKFWMIPANQQAGAVGTRSGKSWTIQDCVIRWASGVGIDFGNEGANGTQDLEVCAQTASAIVSSGHTIMNCKIEYNGAAGTAAYMVKNATFMHNIVRYNNYLRFYGKQRWESAGIKIHRPINCSFKNNNVENNWCHGMWCDQGAGTGSIIQSNFFTSNCGAGINFEIGQQTLLNAVANVFTNNETGITFVTSGGVTVENNVFESSKKTDIEVVLFSRPNDKWDSDNLRIYGNRFGNLSPMYYKLTANDPSIPARRFLKNNKYGCSAENKKFAIVNGKQTAFYCFEDWKAFWMSNGSQECETDSAIMG